MNKQLLASVVLLAVVAVVGVVYPRPLPTQVIKETIEKLGAFSGPDLLSDYLNFNGIKHVYFNQSMRAATTTPCVISAPTGTSTLLYATADFNISSSTEVTVATFAKNPVTTGTYATTTALGRLDLGAGVKGSIVITGSSTATSGFTIDTSAFQFITGDKLVLGFAGGQHPTSGRPTGTCKAEFLNLGQ